MLYNVVADILHKETLQQTFFKRSAILHGKRPFRVFWAPGWGLMGNVRWSLEAYSGLPISVNWTFSLGVTAEALRANIDWKSAISLRRGQFNRNFQVVAPTNHPSCHKTRVNCLSYGIRIRAQLSFILSQIIRLADRRTDRILIARPCVHSMQRCNYGQWTGFALTMLEIVIMQNTTLV